MDMLFRRSLFSVAVLMLSVPMCSAGADITLQLDDGTILIQNARLTMDGYLNVPGLSYTLRNRTSSRWDKLTLQFEINAMCNGEQKHWSRTEETFLGWMGDPAVQGVHLSEEGKEKVSLTVREYSRVMLFPQGKVDGCDTETINVTLVDAENSKIHIGASGERTDLAKRRADEAAARFERQQIADKEQAERDQIAAAEQAKKDAATAARQKRLATERAKQREEEYVRNAKVRAEEDAKAAEERRRISAACNAIYQNTADKKIKDLTVREEQQVRACQSLGLYPPQ